jgi:hypothetical protein
MTIPFAPLPPAPLLKPVRDAPPPPPPPPYKAPLPPAPALAVKWAAPPPPPHPYRDAYEEPFVPGLPVPLPPPAAPLPATPLLRTLPMFEHIPPWPAALVALEELIDPPPPPPVAWRYATALVGVPFWFPPATLACWEPYRKLPPVIAIPPETVDPAAPPAARSFVPIVLAVPDVPLTALPSVVRAAAPVPPVPTVIVSVELNRAGSNHPITVHPPPPPPAPCAATPVP